ncbi:MAG: DNA lyase [Methanomicrobiaceae archaeon]|nr:DNA lyase [Methanomicrobiaceae archaeon]
MSRIFLLDDNTPFSLSETLSCGQVFRWHEENGWWQGVCQGRLIRIRQIGNRLEYSGCDETFLVYYFHLDADLNSILDSVNKDEYINAAIEKHRGLRIIRQDPWECLLTYICAQNANIPFIERMLSNMSEMSGEVIKTESGTAHAYPTSEKLSLVCETDVSGCSTGYRSSYICSTAYEIFSDKMWADKIYKADYESARKEIMRYKGIGRKVADCILLFGFQKYESFPVDRWVDRIMHKYYGVGDSEKPLSGGEYEKIRKFGQEYFGRYAGYAQEYLFADR